MADPATVPDNFITLDWGDGTYVFRLPIGQLAELQTKCGAGLGKIFARLHSGRYQERSTGDVVLNPLQAEFHYEDIVEVIRLGLIGGNQAEVNGQQIQVPPTKAMHLGQILANCAAMNISASEARNMLLWDYEATLVNWNKNHEIEPQVDPATIEDLQDTEAFFAAHPELLN
jgi:hypothetical protein